MKLRAGLRLIRVVLHLFRGMATTAVVFPFCSDSSRQGLKKAWSARLLDILGLQVSVIGEVPKSGLLVSNHISFTDVFAINASMPSSFVAKSDVKSWPLIGRLVAKSDTLFLERGSRAAAQRARQQIVGHLRAGKRVFVFPEGTTSLGDSVLPFHSALFQASIDAGTAITPVALSYADASGKRSYAAAFIGEMTLLESFWSTACANGICIRLTVLPALDVTGTDRRHLSAHAHRAISQHIEISQSRPRTVN